MPVCEVSKSKTVVFTIIVCMAFFGLLELGGRIVLSIHYKTARYLVYGFSQKQRFQQVKVQPPFADYFKGIPSSSNKNPVNSMGFRGPEIGPRRSETVRILCLGASTTYGDNLDYYETYPALLQKMLDQTVALGKYEVINAGQPGFDLNHIISFVQHEGLALQPDVVVVLSVNNNFRAPGFWFVQVGREGRDGGQKKAGVGSELSGLARVRRIFVRYSSMGRIYEDFRLRGWFRYSAEFDWEAFAMALMDDENIWASEYRQNLHALIGFVVQFNQNIPVVVLEQAVNTVDYPCVAAPWEKAGDIMREVAADFGNVSILDVRSPVIRAAQRGVAVWQDESLRDPLHLSKAGNEIIAGTIAATLPDMHADRK